MLKSKTKRKTLLPPPPIENHAFFKKGEKKPYELYKCTEDYGVDEKHSAKLSHMSMHQEERNLQDVQKNDNYSSRGIGDNSELGKILEKVMVTVSGSKTKGE